MRAEVRFEGLALGGESELGPLRFETPVLLESRPEEGEESDTPVLRSEPTGSGQRRLVISRGGSSFRLDIPVLAPEVTPGNGVVRLEDRAALLHAPFDPAALRALREAPPELLILGNARALWGDGESLVAALGEIRSVVGAAPLLWAPRVALPHRIPILAYLGVDVLDTTEGELRAAGGEFLDRTLGGRVVPEAERETGCECVGCASRPTDWLAQHGRHAYRQAAAEARAALRRERLRELVEARVVAEPAAAELLRYADRDLGSLLESCAPVTGSGSRNYVLAESHRRPEMRRFRDRLLSRYRPPPSKSVLLLVPCSRTKPYRRSPSHRRLLGVLEGQRASERVHVVSVSSPIGLVPQELEDVPPARQYDIPVTGSWSAEEREIVLTALRHLLATGSYQHCILHLDPGEYGFVEGLLAEKGLPTERTCVDFRTTAPEAVARLRQAVTTALAAEAPVPGGPLTVVAEELHEVASFQLGREAADRLFARPFRLAGRPWFQRLTDGRQDLASLREERGLYHLTPAGAVRLGDAIGRVDVEPSLSLRGDLFAPGVLGADATVRAGDAVGLFQDGHLAAVGEAVLPGPLLGVLKRGLALRVRHRLAADTAKTAERAPAAGR